LVNVGYYSEKSRSRAADMTWYGTSRTEAVPFANLFSHSQEQEKINRPREDREGERLLGWAADIHFDCAEESGISNFLENVNQQKLSLFILAGDIDVGKTVRPKSVSDDAEPPLADSRLVETLSKIAKDVNCEVFFVCGNHDFYYSSFDVVRRSVRTLCESVVGITYLHESTGIELTPETVLVGHDGWADSRSGDFWNSPVVLRDFFEIEDFEVLFEVEGVTQLRCKIIKQKLEELGEDSAAYAKKIVPGLLKKYHQVIFVTHVPPFRESSWTQGAICGEDGAPFFVNHILGQALVEIMREHPDKKLLVLCGHTHWRAEYRPLHNLTVLTAAATYGKPAPETAISI